MPREKDDAKLAGDTAKAIGTENNSIGGPEQPEAESTPGDIPITSINEECADIPEEVLRALSEDKGSIRSIVLQASMAAQRFSGPLPHPDIFRQYEEILPGTAERLLTSFETQGEHRRRMEEKALGSQTGDSRLGLWLGFFLALTMIVGSALMVLNGYEVSGGILGGTTITALAGTFVYGSRQKAKMQESYTLRKLPEGRGDQEPNEPEK